MDYFTSSLAPDSAPGQGSGTGLQAASGAVPGLQSLAVPPARPHGGRRAFDQRPWGPRAGGGVAAVDVPGGDPAEPIRRRGSRELLHQPGPQFRPNEGSPPVRAQPGPLTFTAAACGPPGRAGVCDSGCAPSAPAAPLGDRPPPHGTGLIPACPGRRVVPEAPTHSCKTTPPPAPRSPPTALAVPWMPLGPVAGRCLGLIAAAPSPPAWCTPSPAGSGP